MMSRGYEIAMLAVPVAFLLFALFVIPFIP
jgi:hypothetical protein